MATLRALRSICLGLLLWFGTEGFIAARGRFRRRDVSRNAIGPPIPGARFSVKSQLPAIREAVAEQGLARLWSESAACLTACGMDTEDAEEILAKGLGWSTWLAVNRAEYLKPKAPEPAALQRSVAFLKDGPLRLSGEELRQVLLGSPKAAVKDPKAAYESSLATAPEEFQTPAAFRALLLRSPTILELSFNCGHRCSAACGRCWCPALVQLRVGAVPAKL
ncbi:unnamed protein product [Effrenium voratum]|uniref:Uncharacterized protein n=1 Tax=Effrenium voratum TaxID=2562239 RepID=A0AA36J6N6_9DINO|nr:unnamed protein product [Effrenium voratum]CAJ1399508.1 unnamed protein product [Effrenium voratum]CAJ1461015.1 unnamed protein product [Effrenium voratum]